MAVRFIRFTNPLDVNWYQNLFDVMVLALLAVSVASAIQAWKRGRRDFAVLLIAAPLYGMALEISGMLTHKSYLQGEFAVMFAFTRWDAFKGSTDVPLYVPLFYPSFLYFGYRLTETFGITSRWRRAVAGGCMMGLLDVTYIIQGGLRHVVWWTWRPYEMYQLWLGWPGIDLWWEMTWGAFLFWMLYVAMPRIDRRFAEHPERRLSNHLYALVVTPLVLVVLVNAVGPILMIPPTAIATRGGQYWPWVGLMAGVATAILLGSKKHPAARVDRVVATLATIYITAFVPMLIGNLLHEGGVTLYLAFQGAALAGIAAVVAYPAWARDRKSAVDDGIGRRDRLPSAARAP